MKLRIILGVLAALCVTVPTFAQKSATNALPQITDKTFRAAAAKIEQMSAGSLRLVHLSATGQPQIMVGNVEAQTQIVAQSDLENAAAVQAGASNYVRANLSQVLGVTADAEVRHVSTISVGNSWHSSFEIAYNNIPLRDRRVHLHTGMINGKVLMLRSNIPTSAPNTATASITDQHAFDVAEHDYSGGTLKGYSLTEPPTLAYVNLPGPTDVTLAYETILSDGFHQWRYTIDATNGAILEKRDMVECDFSTEPSADRMPYAPQEAAPSLADYSGNDQSAGALETLSGRVTAKVHLKTPTDSLTTVGLRSVYVNVNGKNILTDSLGYWTTAGSYPVKITTQLSGPYFVVQRQDGGTNATFSKTINSGSLDVLWDSTNSDVSERDACNAVGTAHDHVIGIDPGLTKLNTQRINVRVNENNTCNAYYDPSSVALNFFNAGGGCVNTAEIADVVEHEFGHRVNHVRYVAAGAPYMVDMTLNEGFADLSSNFLRDNPVIGQGFTGKNSTLRTSDNTKQWPKDISADGHMSGTIIAGAIWDYRKIVGHDIAEREFNLCGYHTPDGTGFNDPNSLRDAFLEVLSAMLLVDDDNNNLADGTPHSAELLKAFAMHNIGIQNYFDINVEPIADADETASSYPVDATVDYSGPVGAVNKDSVMIHYSVDNGKTYSALPLALVSGDQYHGSIPKVASHTVVRYYLSAVTSYAGAGTAVFPLFTAQPFAFAVGYDSKYLDNCETDNGWSLSIASDPATAGFWTRDYPFGVGAEDSDHSANGKFCYVTSDAVTGGAVTLTTNQLDITGMSDPIVRYWYFYSNDQGKNGGAPVFKTQISVNGGTSWKTMQSTTLSTQGWKPYVFRYRDVASLSSKQFLLRFIANDYVAPEVYPQMNAPAGTVTMAGIDDLEILDQAPLAVSSAAGAVQAAVWPNPVRHGEAVSITGATTGVAQVQLVNELGEAVLKEDVQLGLPLRLQIPSNLAAGVYGLLISSDGTTEQTKLIVW